MNQLLVTYGDVYLDWDLGPTHPTRAIRAKNATELLRLRIGQQVQVVEPISEATREADLIELKAAASEEHIESVLGNNTSSLWSGANPRNSEAALAMFAGTVRITQALLQGQVRVGFNPQGAKHHAHFDYGSGFCEFNDMAWAAKTLQSAGLRPLYLDWDIHAGDGVYDDLNGTGIPVLSIHNGSAYPHHPEMSDTSRGGRYTMHQEERNAYNWCLNAQSGDEDLNWAIAEASEVIRDYKPGVILLAAGADGHGGPNLLNQELAKFTYAGFDASAQSIANLAKELCEGRVLIGGAGGYQPDTHTPEIWARVVERIFVESRSN